jgi:hypothetical protein
MKQLPTMPVSYSVHPISNWFLLSSLFTQIIENEAPIWCSLSKNYPAKSLSYRHLGLIKFALFKYL